MTSHLSTVIQLVSGRPRIKIHIYLHLLHSPTRRTLSSFHTYKNFSKEQRCAQGTTGGKWQKGIQTQEYPTSVTLWLLGWTCKSFDFVNTKVSVSYMVLCTNATSGKSLELWVWNSHNGMGDYKAFSNSTSKIKQMCLEKTF